MVNTLLLRRNFVLKLSSAKFPATIRSWLWPVCFCVAWLAGAPAPAAIGTSGNVLPLYPGFVDPWNVGGPLYVAHTALGNMGVSGGSDVISTDGWIGYTSIGTVSIQNSGSSWVNIGDLSLGHLSLGGIGWLTTFNNGTVYVGDAASSGAPSGWLTVSDADSSGTGGGNLNVYNGSTLTHGSSAIVGDDAGEYGWATVDGADSTWTNSGWLYVGNQGSGTLTVQNGGSISNTHARLGYDIGSSGTATVDGTDSTWQCTSDLWLGRSYDSGVGSLTISGDGTLYLGDAASSSSPNGRLTISDSDSSGTAGGRLYVYHGSILDHGSDAVLGDDAGEYGWATVDGADSTWTNSESLLIGHGGTGTLTVQNGGSVSNTYGYIGLNTGSTGTATVDGTGSTWENTGDLSLGRSVDSGVGSLTISDNGTVWVGDAANIGPAGWLTVSDTDSNGTAGGHLHVYSGSTLTHGGSAIVGHNAGEYGWATIDGADSTWQCTGNLLLGKSNNSGVGSLTTSDGGTVYVGDSASSGGAPGWLTVSDSDSNGAAGGQLALYNGSTLTHGSSAIVGDNTGEYGWATVAGAGSTWANTGWLYVGDEGSGTLTIQNGGSVSNTTGRLGYDTGSTGTATVDGTDSTWECTSDLWLGRSADSGVGSLTISDGGTVYVGDSASNSGAPDRLTISDADSNGTAGGHLYVYNGSTLTHGSLATVGENAGEYGWATVDGTGSTWTNYSTLYIGYYGSGTLTIQNGGSVSNTSGYIGLFDGNTGTVTVDGTTSTWQCTGDLVLGIWGMSGDSGVGSLTISDGGTVYVGDRASSGGAPGWLTVSDSESSFLVEGGKLFLFNGSTLTHGSSAVVGDDASEYGWATVDGTGSSWTNNGNLYVGDEGSGTLTIQNGGSVTNTSGFFGFDIGSSGTATVDGTDSTWQCTSDLWLGRSYDSGVGSLTISGDGTLYLGDAASSSSPNGRLTISDSDSSGTAGGHLYIYNASTLIHGRSAIVGNNTGEYGWATVAGAGSTWANNGPLFVGLYGSGSLTIQNGGSVSSTSDRLGEGSSSTGMVMVDGAGSSWTSSDLSVGENGMGTLTVQNGGSVSSTVAVLGFQSSGIGTVTVDGIGSSWTNNGQLYVGRHGQGALTITNGGLVSVAGPLTIDWNTDGDSFINIATGGMLALFGDADDSLTEFFELIDGTDAINYWDNLISDWAPITSATPGADYTLEYIDGTGSDLDGFTMLTVVMSGDFDGDGDVDGYDFLAWQRGESPNPLSQSDLDAWQESFGNVASSATAASTGVPEPSTVALLAMGLAVVVTRRRVR